MFRRDHYVQTRKMYLNILGIFHLCGSKADWFAIEFGICKSRALSKIQKHAPCFFFMNEFIKLIHIVIRLSN